MHNASDYGYSTAGQMSEHRTKELCLRRAASCEDLAARYPHKADEYRRWAQLWRIESDYAAVPQ